MTNQNIEQSCRVYSARELLELDVHQRWIAHNIIQAGKIGLLVAQPKVGKTTFSQHLAIAVSRGNVFLNGETLQGPVLYIALEGGRQGAKQAFEAKGLRVDDNVFIIHNRPRDNRAPSQVLRELIQALNPVLVVIDSFMLWERQFNENSYNEVYSVIREYVSILDDFPDTTILLIHHSGKSLEGGDGCLGSSAFFGGVDSKIQIYRRGGKIYFKIDHRSAPPVEPTEISFDFENGTVSCGSTISEHASDNIKDQIYDFIRQHKSVSRKVVIASISGQDTRKITALAELENEGKITKTNKGNRNGGIVYSVPNSSPKGEEEGIESIPKYIEYGFSSEEDYLECLENINEDLRIQHTESTINSASTSEEL